MLVKIGHGASVNPDNSHYGRANESAQKCFCGGGKMDDNTKQPIAFFDDRDEAIAMGLDPVQNINDAE